VTVIPEIESNDTTLQACHGEVVEKLEGHKQLLNPMSVSSPSFLSRHAQSTNLEGQKNVRIANVCFVSARSTQRDTTPVKNQLCI
jgi:hypothetical protein